MGIPRTRGLLYLPWQPLEIPFAITHMGKIMLGDLFLRLPRAYWSPICRCGSFGRGILRNVFFGRETVVSGPRLSRWHAATSGLEASPPAARREATPTCSGIWSDLGECTAASGPLAAARPMSTGGHEYFATKKFGKIPLPGR